jgi:hypothetical protein
MHRKRYRQFNSRRGRLILPHLCFFVAKLASLLSNIPTKLLSVSCCGLLKKVEKGFGKVGKGRHNIQHNDTKRNNRNHRRV